MVSCGRGCPLGLFGLVWLWFGLLRLVVVIFGAVAVLVVVLRLCSVFGGCVRFWICWHYFFVVVVAWTV